MIGVAVQKAVLVETESERLNAKSMAKKVMLPNVQTMKNQLLSNSVTQKNAQSGKLASGANARKHVVVELSIGKSNSYLFSYNFF